MTTWKRILPCEEWHVGWTDDLKRYGRKLHTVIIQYQTGSWIKGVNPEKVSCREGDPFSRRGQTCLKVLGGPLGNLR